MRARGERDSIKIYGIVDLFYIGPIRIFFRPSLTVNIGQLSVDDSRVLRADVAGLPVPARNVVGSGSNLYSDAAWCLSIPGAGFCNPSWAYTNATASLGQGAFWSKQFLAPYSDPMITRALVDDDRALTRTSDMTLTAQVGGDITRSFGPFTIHAAVTGQISGQVLERHRVRESLVAQRGGDPNAMTPITTLTVRPETEASAWVDPLNIGFSLDFDLDLVFGHIRAHRDVTIYNAPRLDLAKYTNVWPESSTFRLGTGSSAGDPLKQPAVTSHMPKSGAPGDSYPTFGSFEDQTVDSSLADNSPNPAPPPRCGAKPNPPGKAPTANLCVYGPMGRSNIGGGFVSYLPNTNVCANPNALAPVGLSQAQTQCVRAAATYLCSPIGKAQALGNNGIPVVAHVLDPANDASTTQFRDIVAQCANAFVSPSGNVATDTQHVNTWFASFFGFQACDGTATLVDQLITGVGNPQQAPPVTGNSCNN